MLLFCVTKSDSNIDTTLFSFSYLYVCFTHKKWYSQCTFHLNHSFGSHLLFSTFQFLRAVNRFFFQLERNPSSIHKRSFNQLI